MLFMYIHTHPAERCPVNRPDETKKMLDKFEADAKKAGMKVIGMYVAPHEHTVYGIFEASDLEAAEKAAIPMTLMGNARMIPVLTMQQAIAIGK
jgi:uncharacterized protein with GYD domain